MGWRRRIAIEAGRARFAPLGPALARDAAAFGPVAAGGEECAGNLSDDIGKLPVHCMDERFRDSKRSGVPLTDRYRAHLPHRGGLSQGGWLTT